VPTDHTVATFNESTAPAQIDDLDDQIIALLDERKRICETVQRARVNAGKTRVELARECEIFRRYHAAFGKPGITIASAFQQICRDPSS